MAEQSEIKVVLFDLDDTLWDISSSMKHGHQAWQEAVRGFPGGEALAESHDWIFWTDASPAFQQVKSQHPEFQSDNRQVRLELMRRACSGIDAESVEKGYLAWT
eukprot:3816904-Amphidinium_carterae.1